MNMVSYKNQQDFIHLHLIEATFKINRSREISTPGDYFTSIGGSFVAIYITNLGPIEFLFYFLI